ncbi:MAG: TolC family protein [Planctomycetes bacterium]|nr:TolC family protein [Planctomycetota bacterium]
MSDYSGVEQLPDLAGAVATDMAASPYHLSLDEAKSRALENSVIMQLASEQVIAKCHALEAARKDYLPKLLNSFSYFHFDSDLGTVLTTPGIFNPATTVAVPVIEQDSTIYTAAAIQPITPLLKVKQAVNIGEVDVATARAQRDFARRELTKGVEQLYLGLFAAQQIRGWLEQAAAGAQQLITATNSPDAKISLVEVQQNLVTVNGQIVTVKDQLNQLINLPSGTELVLDQPPAPQIPFACPDDAAYAAVASSPKIREARLQAEKAEAVVRLAEADYYPSVNAYGFYVNQNATPTIQEDFTGVGMSASYLLEWGKKRDTLRQWQATHVLARKNLQKEIQDLQLNAAKAFHKANRTQQALNYARQLAKLNREAQLPADPFQLKFAAKDRLEAELGAIKADLDYRNAVVELRAITGQCE